jgi:hypothetical protein
LACADLVLHDGEPHKDAVEELCEQLNVKGLAESEDEVAEHDACVQHLLTQSIPLEGTAKRPAVEWIRAAAGLLMRDEQAQAPSRDEARKMLGRYGLLVTAIKAVPGLVLAVASNHMELSRLFAGTKWGTQVGLQGVWTQALRRIPGARPSGDTSVWFPGSGGPRRVKATYIPLVSILTDPGPGDIPPSAESQSEFIYGGKR